MKIKKKTTKKNENQRAWSQQIQIIGDGFGEIRLYVKLW